jgi:sterol desaturase/sphingolipid hydroxylase (fatty acid hydroxylase superfamily)
MYIAYCIRFLSYGKSIKHTTVKEMGFAAHFRYNWMEPLVYKSILYIPIILIECKPTRCIYCAFHLDCYWSLEPCQLRLGLRLLKYIFNNPKMHIWHHSKKMPNKYGVNFGISLSVWDYILKPTTSLKMEET